ncbi:hypothetical protein PACTADRAFT_50977 [Pachysolen tannophilus NRRL Y-2460]|uniref:Protein KTI12 n=1 Tax=Pachysolen tannophilus NRRL Y-2460 TaxID=669874 RepID=A0A1E4TQX7_PACTA|nr:hypothetical protein PACTADRAFT_50977 [Pachysolen tannophilus NRRL Y-2460]
MPLVLFTGFPSSGKSRWANLLKEKLNGKIASLKPGEAGSNMKVILHSDESLGISHDEYKDSRTEKSLRGTQMSAVKRDISKNTIVILDSPAYIKGFRYQLFCESKALSTSYCVIHVMAPSEKCFEYNSQRPLSEQWDEELLKHMIMRYEEPDGNNRWDSPLFNIAYDDTELPFTEIWGSLILSKVLKPNNATVLKPATEANFLQKLEKITSEVINKIIQHQQLQSIGGDVLIEEGLYVELPPKSVSLAQLQRIRRTYIGLNRMRTVDNDRIGPLFVQFLNNSLAEDD